MNDLFETLFDQNQLPTPSIALTTDSTAITTTIPIPTSMPIVESTGPSVSLITSNPIGIDILIQENYEFGTARSDLHKKGSRFEWTKQEIHHLQHYIENVEPYLSESERRNRHASCLLYLKRSDSLIQQDFHPHHCETSSRIKTGYELALKTLGFDK